MVGGSNTVRQGVIVEEKRKRRGGGEEGGIKFTVCSEPDCVLLKLFGRSLNRARRKMSVLRINYFVCQSWIKKIFQS